MYEPVEKTPEQKSQSVANTISQRQSSNAPTPRFVDNRPEAIQMRKLRDLAKNSPQNDKLRDLHHLAATHSVVQQKSNGQQGGRGFVDYRPEAGAQQKLPKKSEKCSWVTQLQALQAQTTVQTKDTVQLQATENNYSAQQQEPIKNKVNKTGISDDIKSGIENLPGDSKDDVKVHYGTDKPTKLKDLANNKKNPGVYGQKINVTSKAWHEVQQQRSRLKNNNSVGEMAVTNNTGLNRDEYEMGHYAVHGKFNISNITKKQRDQSISHATIQRSTDYEQQLAIMHAWQTRTKPDAGLRNRISFQPNAATRTEAIENLDIWRAENTRLRNEIEVNFRRTFDLITSHQMTNYMGDGMDNLMEEIIANNNLIHLLNTTYTYIFVYQQKAILFAVESNKPNLINESEGGRPLHDYETLPTFLAALTNWVNRYFLVQRALMIEQLKVGAHNGGTTGASVWNAPNIGGFPSHLTIYNNDMGFFSDHVLPIGASVAAHIDNHQSHLMPNGYLEHGTHLSIETGPAGNARIFGNPADVGRIYGALLPAGIASAQWAQAADVKIANVWQQVVDSYAPIVDVRAG